MPLVSSTLRTLVALITLFVSGMAVASAADTDERSYATLLRTINPNLQVHQSLAYAHSLVVDAERSRLDPRLVVALVTVESDWHPNAVSHSGARGLGQLMPSTAAGLGVNAQDPTQNIRGATAYLRAMLNHYAHNGHNRLRYAIGAYNAGPHAVDRFHGIPPYRETQNYVRKVLAMWNTIKARLGSAFADAIDGPTGVAASQTTFWLGDGPAASALPVSVTSADATVGAVVPTTP
jgi:soluble lytic murein transglycosylase-like protein